LATQVVYPHTDAIGNRQSLICANLLAWLFRSVFPCLRGESSSPPIHILLAANVLSGTLRMSGVLYIHTVGNQRVTLCGNTSRTRGFC
jgi:hypothetical protein